MKRKDPICEFCDIQKLCHTIKNECAPLSWVDGKAGGRENLLSNIKKTNIDRNEIDYNVILADNITNQQERISSVIETSNTVQKAITILLLAGFSKADVARFMHVCPKTLYNYTHK